MAAFNGASLQVVVYDTTNSKALARQRFEGAYEEHAPLNPLGVGDHTAVGGNHVSAKTPTNYDGYQATEYTVGFDWFDKVHLIPRTQFAFGVVVSQVTDDFEIFSAHRTAIDHTAVVNNFAAGEVTIPDIPSPTVTLDPFTSFTNASSTRLNYINTDILVAKDGVPIFDDTIDLTFSTGQVVQLRVSGTRVSLVSPVHEETVQELWSFVSDTIESDDGGQQVLSLTENPIQTLILLYLLDGAERQTMQQILHGAQGTLLAMPVWTDMVDSTAAATALDTSISVKDTTDVDFRVGGLATVYDDLNNFDVVVLSAVSANSLTFTTTPLINSYASGVRVAPVRLGYIVNDPSSLKYKTDLESFTLVFRVIDNDVGMFSGDTSAFNSYDGKVLLDDCNLITGEGVRDKYSRRITIVDNEIGAMSVATEWPSNRRVSTKGFSMRSRSEIMDVKKLLLALRGQQKSFRIPTFHNDLTLAANIVAATTTVDVVNVGINRFSSGGEPKKVFRITFTDGTSLNRVIQSSSAISSTVERLTLDTTWPDPRTISEVSKIEFLELSRFASDSFRFNYSRIGRATLTSPVQTLIE